MSADSYSWFKKYNFWVETISVLNGVNRLVRALWFGTVDYVFAQIRFQWWKCAVKSVTNFFVQPYFLYVCCEWIDLVKLQQTKTWTVRHGDDEISGAESSTLIHDSEQLFSMEKFARLVPHSKRTYEQRAHSNDMAQQNPRIFMSRNSRALKRQKMVE